jgi:hypothetical protein
MDWNRAITINREALKQVVANLVAMLEFVSGGKLSEPIYRTTLLILRPAESAVRRLIIMCARGIKVEVAPSRPMKKGLAIARSTGRVPAFKLYDTRKRFNMSDTWNAGPKSRPRVSFIDAPPPLIPQFHAALSASYAPILDKKLFSAKRLEQRITALKVALDTLPRQAIRMARWRARRELMTAPKFRSPLRPGPPPGHRKRNRDPVDEILKDCHALAIDAMRANTS